jgi:hypothetical protein
MVVGVGFCKIKVDSNFLLVLKIKCTKFHQDRSKTVDLHTKYTNKQTFSFIYIDFTFFHSNTSVQKGELFLFKILNRKLQTQGAIHETLKGSIRHCKFKTMTIDIVEA